MFFLNKTPNIRLLKNSFFNGLGLFIPLLVGLITIPKIINILGVEAFGVLTIVWLILGYFSLFDLGFGRGFTKIVSEKINTKDIKNIANDLYSHILIIFLISIFISFFLYFFAAQISNFLFDANSNLLPQIEKTIVWISLGLPAVTCTSVLKGFIEAYKDFKNLNILQVGLGLFNFISPLFVIESSNILSDTVLVLMVARWLFLIFHLLLCCKFLKNQLSFKFSKSTLKRSLAFGGWITISNIIGPLMLYFDRFILSAISPSSYIAYYTTPFEITNRLLAIPQAVTRALFPEISSSNVENRKSVLKTSLKTITFLMLPPILVFFFFSFEILNWWIGVEFAQNSSNILKLLSLGIFINSLAWIPYTELQSSERADLTAKLHLAELVFYIPFLIWFVNLWGIFGAAIMWTLRATIDAIILFWLNYQNQKGIIK